MKIKIFKMVYTDSNMESLESQVNSFIAGKTVIQIQQTVVNKGAAGSGILITVLYKE